MTTVFAEIISGKINVEKIFESDLLIAIHDIHPQAPVHILLIPKKHYKSLQTIPNTDKEVFIEVVNVSQHLAKQFKIEDNYRLVTNVGKDAGQTILHLHFHLIGGSQLGSIV